MKLCSIDDCNNKHLAIGLCNKHYRRHRAGTELNRQSCYDMDIKNRLISFVRIENACWIWTGAKNRKGYGQISIKNKIKAAHRVSYEVHKGEITCGMIVCHNCDIPSCINPDHLFIGTVKDNTQDMLIKKRNRPIIGSSNGNSKLKNADIVEIKHMISSKVKLVEIAKKFNVTPENIAEIRNGKTWGHINV